MASLPSNANHQQWFNSKLLRPPKDTLIPIKPKASHCPWANGLGSRLTFQPRCAQICHAKAPRGIRLVLAPKLRYAVAEHTSGGASRPHGLGPVEPSRAAVVEILPAQVWITSGGFHLEHGVGDRQDRNLGCSRPSDGRSRRGHAGKRHQTSLRPCRTPKCLSPSPGMAPRIGTTPPPHPNNSSTKLVISSEYSWNYFEEGA